MSSLANRKYSRAVPVTFGVGDKYSSVIDAKGDALIGVEVGATWPAADLVPQRLSGAGGTAYKDLTRGGTRVYVDTVANTVGLVAGGTGDAPCFDTMRLAARTTADLSVEFTIGTAQTVYAILKPL